MRTLLIDNYDSYTYNLFQLIAEVNGAEPEVVRNDITEDRRPDPNAFDNVVLSPGPGRPDRPGDFGFCSTVIERTAVPLLGVCLGHQGIASAFGAAVEHAPRARHGHVSKVEHRGVGVFHGLPRMFAAVRYHSLCVREPLPPELAAIAWAEDGVVMGLRHRFRPLWGVQFHPESVVTEFGRRMLANFRSITTEHRAMDNRGASRSAGAEGTSPPARESAVDARDEASREPDSCESASTDSVPAPASSRTYRLRCAVLERPVDAEWAFTALFSGQRDAFWLDSSRVEPGLSRFSHLGDASGPLGELVTYRIGAKAVTVFPSGGGSRGVPGTIFDYLERELARRNIAGPRLPFDYSCGYVGYFGYELKQDCGMVSRHRSTIQDAQWLFVDRAVTVDHEHGRTYVLTLDDNTRDGIDAAARWRREAVSVLGGLPDAVEDDLTPSAGDLPPNSVEPWLSRPRQRYLADIRACQQKLHDGESYEMCLTNTAVVPAVEDGFRFYQRLRRCNPAPYGAYLRFGDVRIACSSPERFLRVDCDGFVEAKPIKGTAPRGARPDEDERLRTELTTSAKVYAENLMIVDLLRNDLSRVCAVSSVHVPKLMSTETYATVHQLVSTIRGRLRPEAGALDCVRTCFPAGSMTGAPKRRTVDLLDSLENRPRGVYSGSIGFLGCDGTADLNVVIRTAVLADGYWHVGAGGAIVLDSDPRAEYAEMLLKAQATLRAQPVRGS